MRILVIVCLLLSGCVTANVTQETVLDDGSSEKCSAEYSSFWKDLNAAEMSACSASGKAETSTQAVLGQVILNALSAGITQ